MLRLVPEGEPPAQADTDFAFLATAKRYRQASFEPFSMLNNPLVKPQTQIWEERDTRFPPNRPQIVAAHISLVYIHAPRSLTAFSGANIKGPLMTGNVQDLPRTKQVERLEEMSDTFVDVIDNSAQALTTREALQEAASQMDIMVSQAKYGLTYAKAVGRVHLDQSTLKLYSISHR